jgi:hypothetical protein
MNQLNTEDTNSIRDYICRRLIRGEIEPDVRMLPLVRQVNSTDNDTRLYPRYDKNHSSYKKALENYMISPSDNIIQPPN